MIASGASPCGAAEVEQYLTALEWRNIGPNIGGRSIAVAGSSQRPHEYYFGATGGGLWKTTDGGTEWAPVTDGAIPSSSVGAVAVDPEDPDVVYIGMGEGQLRANVMQGDGIYKTTDGGATWQHLGLEKTCTITTIRIHPQKTNIVYAAALGDPFAPNPERGIYRSQDGGQSWQKILERSPRAGAIDLAMDPNNPDVLFATIWQVYRKPWKLWSGGPQSGIFKSSDGGDTWTEITRNPGLPTTVLGKMTVAVSGANSNRVYANIEADAGGLYRSDDGGATWTHVNGNRKLWQRSFYFLQVRADPVDRDTLYVLSFRLEKSVNGGKSFFPVPTRHVDIHDLWIDPGDPRRMVVGDDGGGSVTVDGGKTWTEQDYPTAQMYRVVTTNDFPYHVCGTQQDNMAVAVPSRSGTGLPGFQDVYAPYYNISGSESGYVAPHPAKPHVFFVGATNQLTRFDRTTGLYRDVQPFPFVVMGEAAANMTERWNWSYPIVFSPRPPHALYIGSQHVWRSHDEGVTWQKISDDLTRADPSTLGETGGPVRLDQDGPEVYATLYTIAPSPLDRDVIWTGSDDGLIHLTRDGGKSWTNVTPPELPANSRVSFIDASPHSPDAAYVAVKRYELGDRTPYVWKTKNAGRTWQRIDANLPREHFVHAIRADKQRDGLLYLGTEHGVYVSFDDGADWHSLSLNLPDTHVSGLEVKGDELVISTHGRSFYVLEALAMLRQMPTAQDRGRNVLFAPGDAIRRIVPAQIDFFLTESITRARIEIVDSQGKTVRRLVSRRSFDAGAHRVTWNLRHDGATVFPFMILESLSPTIGPLAVPGRYVVRLTAGELMLEQPLHVKVDPRLSQEIESDLAAQLEFALNVRDAISQANQTVIEIRGLRRQIKSRLRDAEGGLAAAAEPLLEKIGSVEAELYQVKNSSPKDKIAYPIQLNDRLAGLASFVAFTDAAPTPAQRQIYKLLSAQLADLMSRYQAAQNEELAAFNEILTRQGREPVELKRKE